MEFPKDYLIQMGPKGAHCNIPGSKYETRFIQSFCAKTCCQCQGTLRCKEFTDNPYNGPPSKARNDYQMRQDSNYVPYKDYLETILKDFAPASWVNSRSEF